MESQLRPGRQAVAYDPDRYWDATEASYPHYPTVRHRQRFILNAIARARTRGLPFCAAAKEEFTVFDFGCGEATLLRVIADRFSMADDRLGGCDISARAIGSARRKIRSPYVYHALFPALPRPFDVMTCSEVIEHTRDYRAILGWMHRNLAPGGLLVLTTQTGKIHGSDRYTGHTQHFAKRELEELLRDIGFVIERSRLWGWPFFTIQKYLTDFRFEGIRCQYLEGGMTPKKRLVFDLAYAAYFLHNRIPFGPQVFVTARK